MDKRYIKLIADNMPGRLPSKLRKATKALLGVLLLGFVLLFNSTYAIYGFGIGVAASIGMIFVGYKGIKHRRQVSAEFIEDYEKTGHLPPWPEDEVKSESPQPSH